MLHTLHYLRFECWDVDTYQLPQIDPSPVYLWKHEEQLRLVVSIVDKEPIYQCKSVVCSVNTKKNKRYSAGCLVPGAMNYHYVKAQWELQCRLVGSWWSSFLTVNSSLQPSPNSTTLTPGFSLSNFFCFQVWSLISCNLPAFSNMWLQGEDFRSSTFRYRFYPLTQVQA